MRHHLYYDTTLCVELLVFHFHAYAIGDMAE